MKKTIAGNNANHPVIKLLIFIVNILVLINYSYSTEQRVPGVECFASCNHAIMFQLKNPQSDEFIIEIKIYKGNIENFARFELKLPPGFVAIPIETHGGKFKFKNQKITLTWMKLPEESSFTISFDIKVYNDFSEVLIIGTKFQCVVEKKKRTFTSNKRISSMPENAITINISAKGGKINKKNYGGKIGSKIQNVKGMFGKQCYPDKNKKKYNVL